MRIGYASKKLQKICNQTKAAAKLLKGTKIPPDLLFQRIGELGAFSDLGQIPFQATPLHFHPLRGDWAGAYAVTLHSLWRIVFEPAGEFEQLEDGSPDKSTVTDITILAVENYHG